MAGAAGTVTALIDADERHERAALCEDEER